MKYLLLVTWLVLLFIPIFFFAVANSTPFLGRIYKLNPRFVEWLYTNNPYYSELTRNGLDEYGKLVIEKASSLGDMAPCLLKMPEVYSEKANLTEVLKYIDLIKKAESKNRNAAQWILETGLFFEDKKISSLEEKFFQLALKKKDLFRVLVSKYVLDGVDEGDLSKLNITYSKKASPYNLGYLTDDLLELPEIKDGVSSKELAAIKQLEQIINVSKKDYQVKKGLYLIDEYGLPDESRFSFKVPRYNTQLQVLLHLVEDREIPESYYRIVLACSIDYGALSTISDDKVTVAIMHYVPKILDFVIETDQIIKKYGGDWQAKNYPLEADIALVWDFPGQFYPNFKEITDKTGNWGVWNWHYIYSGVLKRPQNINDFMFLIAGNFSFKGREFMVKEFLGENEPVEINMPYKSMQKKYLFRYLTKIDRLAANLDDYFFINNEHVDFDVPEEIIVNGRVIVGEFRCPFHIEWYWSYFTKTGKFIGACMDNAYIQSLLLRYVNVPAIIGTLGHAFPVYYNPRDKVWRTNPYEQDIILNMETYKDLRGYTWGGVPWDNWHNPYCQCKNVWDRFKPNVDVDARYKLFYRLAVNNHAKQVYPQAWSLGIPLGYIYRQIPLSEKNYPYN